MKLDAACKPIFNQHQTFAPRYGWPKKAYDSCSDQPDLFTSGEGIEQLVLDLAVGKNMVKSIRYWAKAFRICSEEKRTGNRNMLVYPTAIGRTFFSDNGLDPYCEHADTLWLLHWWLHAPGSLAPVWWLVFNEFTGIEFTVDELEQFVSNRATAWEPTPSAITRDVTCLIKMYASGHAHRATFDDQLDCPFRELDLIRPSSREPGMFRFNIGPKSTLSPAVAAFACLDFVARTRPTHQTVMLSTLSTEPGSPGQVFKLTETALLDLLRTAVTEAAGDLKLTSAAGPPQLVVDNPPAQVATELILKNYSTIVGPLRVAVGGVLAGVEADRSADVSNENTDSAVSWDDIEIAQLTGSAPSDVAGLGLSQRSRNCLSRASIVLVSELIKRSPFELLDLRNFGKTSLADVQDRLEVFGLVLSDHPKADAINTPAGSGASERIPVG